MGEKIIIFDTTLRDGEQSPGVSLTFEDKVEIARQLSLLGVDTIEAGFPASSSPLISSKWDLLSAFQHGSGQNRELARKVQNYLLCLRLEPCLVRR